MVVLSPFFPAGSPEAETLGKMMSACKLGVADYSVLWLKGDENISWQSLRTAGAPDRVLFLGLSPRQLGIHSLFPLNTCQDFADGKIIVGSSLTEIVQNPAAKRALWEHGLKPCFGL